MSTMVSHTRLFWHNADIYGQPNWTRVKRRPFTSGKCILEQAAILILAGIKCHKKDTDRQKMVVCTQFPKSFLQEEDKAERLFDELKYTLKR
jgi:hypothetical protein